MMTMIPEAIFLPLYTSFGLQAITTSWDFLCLFISLFLFFTRQPLTELSGERKLWADI